MGKVEQNSGIWNSMWKQRSVLLKLVATFVCVGLALRLFSSSHSHSLFEYPTTSTTIIPSTPPHSNPSDPKCDIFDGEWVANPAGPVYTNWSCNIIESHQNCMRNGRPDSEYLYWRWTPTDCDMPVFDPNSFLLLMRNKCWGFIGDSISRNHVQSFVCILSQVEPAVEIYHDEAYKSKRWIFPTYNFTVSVIWAPYLITSEIFEDDDGVSTSETLLHLDKLDPKWTSQYSGFDYVIIAGGKWFLKSAIYYENDTMKGCHNCDKAKNSTELGFDYAYRKTLRLVFNFLTNSTHKPLVFFRTITPDHFENGEWDTGGTCVRKVPFKEDEAETSEVDRLMREIEVEEFGKAVVGVVSTLKLLDTTHLSVLRPDGHPGPYRQFQPLKGEKVQRDCLHWCLPGPIDSWNDLLMERIAS